MDLQLKNKIAIISGASKGIGAATALELAKEGTHLVLIARNKDALEKIANDLKSSYPVKVLPITADIKNFQNCKNIIESSIKLFGKVDILINSVGASQGGIFWEISDDVWKESFELKVMGTIKMMRAVIPSMIEKKSGRIVNVIGNTGKQPSSKLLPGSSANAALLTIIKGLSEDLAPHGIKINALNPGPTKTERWVNLMENLSDSSDKSVKEIENEFIKDIPIGKLAEPNEIAKLVMFLASDIASNMTGTCITADGGWTKGI